MIKHQSRVGSFSVDWGDAFYTIYTDRRSAGGYKPHGTGGLLAWSENGRASGIVGGVNNLV